MAKHDTLTDPKIQAAIMRQNMNDRYAYLCPQRAVSTPRRRVSACFVLTFIC